MALITGKIGLEDLALGHGTEVQNLGKNRTRTITKINAENLPFGANSTFAKAMAEFRQLIVDAKTIPTDEIVNIVAELDKIKLVTTSIDSINKLAGKSTLIDSLASNIDSINHLSTTIVKTEQAVRDALYREQRIVRIATNLDHTLGYISNLCNVDILPMKEHLDALIVTMDARIATIQADLVAGNEMIHKFGSYELKIITKRACKNPKIIVDDARKQIIWQVPTVKGSCTMAQPTQEQTSKALAEYLLTHPANITLPTYRLVTANELEDGN